MYSQSDQKEEKNFGDIQTRRRAGGRDGVRRKCQLIWWHLQLQLHHLWSSIFFFWRFGISQAKSLCSRNKKVTKVSAGPKFSHFPTETYLVVVKYQKFPKSIERNWGFWIIFDLERVGHFFEIKSKDDIQMALLTLTLILILVIQIEIQLWILFGKPMW